MKLTKKLVGAYARVFNSPEGVEVMKDLALVLGADDFSEEVEDSNKLWYRAGKRDTYTYIKTMIEEGSK